MEISLYKELYTIGEENTLGKRLKKSRLTLGLSQSELGNLCNLSRSAINGYELDIIFPSKKALLKLGNIIDLNYLCSNEYEKFILSDYIKLLKQWRYENKLSMRGAAKKLGVPSSSYISWEKGIYTINKENYYKIKSKIQLTTKEP
ncbi:helix-turn-helix domain-containing protein [Clostridium niameyense]|uniref:helix-turn-helix domain-containing protein n=1 Tax=Clostridium niameyense TaxID=1622073 RepID=UPI0013D6362F|nr:helix-turn-helix transcriptional regulator [Clostridium niameyense]